MPAEHRADRAALQARQHLLFLALVERLDFHTTCCGRSEEGEVGAAAREVRELGNNLFHEAREDELEIFWNRMALRLHDLHLFADAQRIVRADLRSESVLQWSDDPAARRVVLGVGARDDEEVEWKPYAITADLHVLLFHDVEKADLDSLSKVRELVDSEDAAICARQQSVMDGELVGEVAPFGDLDRVDLADEVRD